MIVSLPSLVGCMKLLIFVLFIDEADIFEDVEVADYEIEISS